MRVAVVGGGVAGLAAAFDLARTGAEVELFEASGRLGGAVSPVTLAGVTVDAGAEAFATRTPAVRELIAELGLSGELVNPDPSGAWLQLPDRVGPLPSTGVLGIPADPRAHDVVHLLGGHAAARAAADLTAPMTWHEGEVPTLGAVVRDRMGDGVADHLVSPITSGVYSASPDALPISAAHPKLYPAMLREGSLARAAGTLRAQAPAGSAVQSLRGGMNTLVSALAQRLRGLGVAIHLDSPVAALHELDAEEVVLALDGPQAGRLVEPLTGAAGQFPSAARGVALVTLVVHAPDLDARPRGTGLLVAPDVLDVLGIGAKAMTHITAKWGWAAEAVHQELGTGHHVVRLSYGRVSDEPGTGTLGFYSSDEDLRAAAMADLPRLVDLPISADEVLDAVVVRWERPPPGAVSGNQAAAEQLEAALTGHNARVASARSGAEGSTPAGVSTSAEPRLHLTGTWFAGTGLAQTIAHARRTAASLHSP